MEQIAFMVHFTTVCILIPLVLVSDALGLLWASGKRAVLNLELMRWLHRLVWTGVVIMLLSGFTMFLSYQDYLLITPAFYVKVFFILTLVTNAFVIGSHYIVATERAFVELTPKERIPLYISGGVSTIAWIGTITAAFMLGL